MLCRQPAFVCTIVHVCSAQVREGGYCFQKPPLPPPKALCVCRGCSRDCRAPRPLSISFKGRRQITFTAAVERTRFVVVDAAEFNHQKVRVKKGLQIERGNTLWVMLQVSGDLKVLTPLCASCCLFPKAAESNQTS